MKKNKKKIIFVILIILGIISLVTATTYALFNYTKMGNTGNTISSASIKFHYAETSQGIDSIDSMPMSDAEGKVQNNYFEFEITSKTSNLLEIPYYITVRRSGTGTNMDDVVKVYLTRLEGNTEVPVELSNGQNIATFSQLGTYTNNSGITIPVNEKLLHRSTVFAGTANYREIYRLRMWISDTAQFIVQVPGQPDFYPYFEKTYSLNVNVYGNGLAINQSTAQFRSNANITDIEVENNVVVTTTDTFNSEVTLAPGETSATKEIVINTENPNAQVTVENITQTAMDTSIKRLSISKNLNLVLGTNTFRITIKSEDRKETKIYTLVVNAKKPNYGVTLNGSNISFSDNSVDMDYGSSSQVTVVPESGYYISGGSCTNNYLINDLNTGVDATSEQIVTISNNDNVGSSTCVFTTTPLTYTITYNLNGGVQSSNPPTSYTVETNTFDLPTPTKSGYLFDGWYENSGFTGESVSQIPLGTIGNKEYYAKWKTNIVAITLDQQGGTGGTGNINATYSQAMPSITVPTKTGYTFSGYYTETNGGGVQYYNASGIGTRNSDIANTTTLYAYWIINQYDLSVSSSVNGNKSASGHSGYTFDVYVNNTQVANDVIDYSAKLDYNASVKLVLNTVANYTAIESTIEKTITGNTELIPAWIISSNVGIQFKYNNATLIVITEGKTWEAAESYAQSLGGHLAMIKTSDMQNFVYNTILANSTVSTLASFWIGATDKAKEGEWRWVDGTTLASTYSNWNSGEPNDSSGEDYCQYYISSNKGKWNDLNGSQSYPFVVQIGTP